MEAASRGWGSAERSPLDIQGTPMPAHDPDLRRKIAAAGAAARNRMPDADDRRAELATARLEAHIRRVVDSAPPLTPAQRDRLAALFAAPVAGDDRSAELVG